MTISNNVEQKIWLQSDIHNGNTQNDQWHNKKSTQIDIIWLLHGKCKCTSLIPALGRQTQAHFWEFKDRETQNSKKTLEQSYSNARRESSHVHQAQPLLPTWGHWPLTHLGPPLLQSVESNHSFTMVELQNWQTLSPQGSPRRSAQERLWFLQEGLHTGFK